MKECAIIGSGLSGLACATILSKNGYHVTVFEQGKQVGGCLQCFKRGNAIFETGMHYIGSADSGQTLHTMFRYLGIESKIQLSRLDPMGYDIISFMGKHYRFANGKEHFINSLTEHFPDSKEELARYYDLIRTVSSASVMHSLSRKVDVNVNAEYQIRSVNEIINSIVTDPLLCEVLAGEQPLYAGEKDHTPFSTHALITDFFNQSAYRIVGGSSKVADSLSAEIQSNGGIIRINQKVIRIECDDSHATAVTTENGETFPADLIISSIHPANTISLINSHLLRPSYRQRILSAPNTSSSFTVYLKYKKNSVKYMNHNLFYYRGDTTWGCNKYDESNWPKSMIYMHFCHEKNPSFAETGEIITYMNFKELEPWYGTFVGHRGKHYEEFKRRKAEKLIDALEEEVPDIRGNIETYYTSTPLTYLDYTGTPEGAMYGVARDILSTGSGNISCKTRIPNLYLTGQSIAYHGMLGVLAGCFMTCGEILSFDKLLSQLKPIA